MTTFQNEFFSAVHIRLCVHPSGWLAPVCLSVWCISLHWSACCSMLTETDRLADWLMQANWRDANSIYSRMQHVDMAVFQHVHMLVC